MNSYMKKWKHFIGEAVKDAKVLRNINIDQIKKEEPKLPDEDIRDYFSRLQALERDPEYLNPVFPQGLVDWVESLPDNHFPTNGRKRYAKWIANAIYTHEVETLNRINSVDNAAELNIYNNDIRYISDYLNGAEDFPADLWDRSLNGMFDLAVAWHETLKGVEGTGDYESKEVVYRFDSGYTIVSVNSENDLRVEGEKMGHCVGSYCDMVNSGRALIFSLRDTKNNPHVTIEVVPSGGRSYSPTVDQIKGKGNAAPVEKYRPMIKQWLETTDFDYENSPDYLNILPDEEVKERLLSGQLNENSEMSLASLTEDPEIIRFFLSQILVTSSSSEEEVNKISKLSADQIVNNLLRNDNLSEDDRLSFIRINFQLRQPLLGIRIKALINLPPSRRNFDPASLSSRVWESLGEKLKSDYDDENLYCMHALMDLDATDRSIKEEIINHLLSDEYIEGAIRQDKYALDYQQQPYGRILQGYLFQERPSEEIVKRLYTIQRDERFIEVLGAVGRINGYIASSRGMTDDLADEIIKDAKAEERYALNQRNWIDMILNPRISDPKRMDLLHVGGERSISNITQPERVRTFPLSDWGGVKWSVSGRSYSRQLVTAAKEKKFSEKFVKYMIGSGIFDPQYVMDWVGEQTKLTGNRPNIEKFNKEKLQDLIFTAREKAYADLEAGIFNSDLFQEIKEYFRENTMTKESLYETIKKQVGITEEVGRSRQRGIYKFYCMLSYQITSGDKARGLDDILADLRALPNVTIVTVVISNQKISEGRYIAGLSIKFIPSVPGQLNSPEDVKVRIIRDIKRLSNVMTVFKVSTGLERIE